MDGEWPEAKESRLEPTLLSEDWEIITLRQASGKSGLPESFDPWLGTLLGFVQRRRPDAVIGWNMTWAHRSGSEKESFKNYDCDQMKMYRAIVNTLREKVLTEPSFRFVIPTGTAIQNARSSYLGDAFNRDGSHLDKGIGRYVASLTWCCRLTGCDPAKLQFAPEGLTKGQIAVAKEAVRNATQNPFAVTQSMIPAE